jgi:Na+-transporting NADH:ubiquinone oxidoreductase subunit NqrD
VLGKIVLILGILGILLGGGVLLVSALLPTLTEGRTSMDEALLGIIPGAIVLIGSFFLAIIGVIVMLMTKKKVRTTT